MKLEFAAQSDAGMRRPGNEDRVLAAVSPDGSRVLLAVADGVGGVAGSAIASQALVEALELMVSTPGEAPEHVLDETVHAVHSGLIARREGGESAGATTLVALLAAGGSFHVAHVGDSRAYLLRDGSLSRLTRDHSLVAEQLRSGVITEAQAAESPRRHVITRSVGVGSTLDVERQGPLPLREGDLFLLCSDGLHDVASDAEIAALLAAAGDINVLARDLVRFANERGGPDNISVVVARVLEADRDR